MYQKDRGLLFIVSAPSGAGKTTLCRQLSGVMPSLSYSISHTTRKPRPGEFEGEHYYFVQDDEFKRIRLAGGFVEWANVHGNLYGTSKNEIERLFNLGNDVILDIDTQGAKQVRDSGVGGVFISLLPPSMEELGRRLRGRDTDDEEVIRRRLERAVEEIRFIVEEKVYDYLIINDNLVTALDDLKSVITAEKNRLASYDLELIKKNFGLN
jgi:guanylate kinase